MGVYPKKGEPGKWRIVVWANGKPNERIYKGKKKEADKHEAEFRLELLAKGPVSARHLPTFYEFCATKYKQHALLHLGAYTWKQRRYHLKDLCTHFGDLRIDEITTEDVLAYKEKRKRAGLKPRSINNELKSLQAVLTYARDELKLPASKPIFRKLKERKGKHASAWTAEEVQRLYAACAKHAVKDKSGNKARPGADILGLVVFCINTGCRKSEAIAMRWEDVDLERGVIRITPYEDEDEGEDFDTKSGEAREVPISDALMPWLEGERRSSVWLFPSAKGGRYAHWPKRQYNAAVKAAELTGGAHKMRHTYATHFLASQPDLHLLGRYMGHSHSKVTELYAHLLPDHHARGKNAVNLAPGIGPSRLEAEKRWRSKPSK